MSSSFVFGDIVEIHGLTSDAGRVLNSCKGTVIGSAADDRLQVHLRGHDGFKAIKPANLKRVFDTYVIKNSTVPGAGRGMFAARDIQPGEEIIAEKALLDDDDAKAAMTAQSKLILLGHLTPADRALFKHLHPLNEPIDADNSNETKESTSITQRQASAIINTNQFAFAGLLFVCSMPNHSCLENASYEFDEDRKMQVIYAMKPISAGEEILINYTGDISPKSVRAMKLLPRHFVCKCALCTHPDSEKIDALVEELHELRDMYPQMQYHSRAEMMGNRIVSISKILVSQYRIESVRRLCAVTCEEMFEMHAQLDAQHGVGSSPQDPKKYERALKWIEMFFELFTPGTHCATSVKWIRKCKKIREFQQNPSSFLGYLIIGSFPRVMNASK